MSKVLLVDDEPDIEILARQKFRKQIAEGTFQLLFALNGQEALNVIKQNPDIKVVVSDVNMPEMDGLTLLDKLRELNPEIRTIVVSAYGDIKTLRSAMNKGVSDFVTKPVDFHELAESITRTLSQYKPKVNSLQTYQLLLASNFPDLIDLNVTSGEPTIIWDAISQENEPIILLGISVLSSSLPFDIGMSAAHAMLKAEILEKRIPSLDKVKDLLCAYHPLLKAHVFIGQYHKQEGTFTFETNDAFKVKHLKSGEETLVSSPKIVLLTLGDVITIEDTSSNSNLSFAHI